MLDELPSFSWLRYVLFLYKFMEGASYPLSFASTFVLVPIAPWAFVAIGLLSVIFGCCFVWGEWKDEKSHQVKLDYLIEKFDKELSSFSDNKQKRTRRLDDISLQGLNLNEADTLKEKSDKIHRCFDAVVKANQWFEQRIYAVDKKKVKKEFAALRLFRPDRTSDAPKLLMLPYQKESGYLVSQMLSSFLSGVSLGVGICWAIFSIFMIAVPIRLEIIVCCVCALFGLFAVFRDRSIHGKRFSLQEDCRQYIRIEENIKRYRSQVRWLHDLNAFYKQHGTVTDKESQALGVHVHRLIKDIENNASTKHTTADSLLTLCRSFGNRFHQYYPRIRSGKDAAHTGRYVARLNVESASSAVGL